MNMKTLIIMIILTSFNFFALLGSLFLKNEVLAALFLWLFDFHFH